MAAKRGCFCTGLNAELPAYRKRQVEIFTEPEIVQLAHHIMDEPDLTGLGVLLTLNSGLRLGELCALRWSDIDLHAGFLRVEREVQRLYEKDTRGLSYSRPRASLPAAGYRFRRICCPCWQRTNLSTQVIPAC